MKFPLKVNPIGLLKAHIPHSMEQFWKELWNIVKIVFWALLVAPIILIPAYYILVAYGLAPQILLPH